MITPFPVSCCFSALSRKYTESTSVIIDEGAKEHQLALDSSCRFLSDIVIKNIYLLSEMFLEILISCKERKTNAAMHLDFGGMIRVEGLIRVIYLDVPNPYLVLESGTKVIIKTIRSANGYCSPSFTENQKSRERYR